MKNKGKSKDIEVTGEKYFIFTHMSSYSSQFPFSMSVKMFQIGHQNWDHFDPSREWKTE